VSAGPVVSVVIVSWNVREDVLRCLASLAADPTMPPHEVVLVDNASVDGTADAVRRGHPHVHVVANTRNEGFPRANNRGVASTRGRHVLFLNPDTEVQPGAVAACLASLEEDARVGASGCRLLLPDGTTQLECARRHYRLGDLATELLGLHVLFPRHPRLARHLMGDWDHAGVRDVEAVSGAFLMVRRTVLDRIGGMPEDLFMYFEDGALCARIGRAGYRIRYRGDVTTLHHHGRSSAQAPAWISLLEVEAKRRLVAEVQGPAAAAAARGLLGVRAAIRLVVSLPLTLVPASAALRRRRPRIFDVRAHALQLAWALWPPFGRARIPRGTA